MTTCAYDGKELAADSQATQDSHIATYTVKIFKTDTYIMAFTGPIDEGYLFKLILDEEIKAKDCKFSNSFCGIVWTDDGELTEWYGSMIPVPTYDKYLAWGSGAEIALAAMHSGKSAREAVELAKKLDIYTGGKVISYSWNEVKKRKKNKNESVSISNPSVEIREVSGGQESSGDIRGDSGSIHDVSAKTKLKVRV